MKATMFEHPMVRLYEPLLILTAPALVVAPLAELREGPTPIYDDLTEDLKRLLLTRVRDALAAAAPADGKIVCPICTRRVKPRRDGKPVKHYSLGLPGVWCSPGTAPITT